MGMVCRVEGTCMAPVQPTCHGGMTLKLLLLIGKAVKRCAMGRPGIGDSLSPFSGQKEDFGFARTPGKRWMSRRR